MWFNHLRSTLITQITMMRFPQVVCVSAPPTMGRSPCSSFVSLPLPQWGDFPAVVYVSAPPTMGRFPCSSLCLCPSHNGEISLQ
ncbi:unnamed protein product [Staurois parvus]|uniref:Secreted protein n=1 Tax=Staurois parvus TaxID=386267 RepID=A0ABN9GC81_9NEOB|nr:unnamed protein product [Staurois parvus]